MNEKSYLVMMDELHKNRYMFLHGAISPEMASLVIREILVLDGESDEPIHLNIMSGGGEIYSGLAIIDAMASVKSPIYTYAMGLCASMAAIIFASGDKKFMGKNSRFMIHQPLGGTSGKLSDMQTTIEEVLRLKEVTSEILSANSKFSKDEILNMIEKDRFLSAKECLEMGFCNEILKTKGDMK